MKRVIGKINPSDKNVSIWGAGFSGLVLGYFLKQQGYNVTIFEKSNKVGGKIQTKKTSSGLAEKGANALYLNADGLELIKELKLEPIPASKKLKRLLMLHGRPRKPFQLSLFTKVALNLHKKPPLISDGLTVAEFFKPLLGTENIQHFLSPVLSGLYAVPSESLHFKTVFHQVEKKTQFNSYWEFLKLMMKIQKEQPKLEISGSVSFEGGMEALIGKLAETLKPNIKLNTKEHLRIRGNTIICTDAINAANLLSNERPELSSELSRIKYQQLSTATVFLKREIRSLQKSFGVLIPLSEGYHSIGVLNNKAIFPINNENVLSYTFISKSQLEKQSILEDLKRLNPEVSEEDIEHIEATNWDKALPVYDLQLFLAVKKLHQLAQKEENLAIFGNYVAGISLREMISAAKNFAKDPVSYNSVI